MAQVSKEDAARPVALSVAHYAIASTRSPLCSRAPSATLSLPLLSPIPILFLSSPSPSPIPTPSSLPLFRFPSLPCKPSSSLVLPCPFLLPSSLPLLAHPLPLSLSHPNPNPNPNPPHLSRHRTWSSFENCATSQHTNSEFRSAGLMMDTSHVSVTSHVRDTSHVRSRGSRVQGLGSKV